MDFALTPVIALCLFATGIAAGFVDSIAGGGGLVALPMLLSVGMPPQLALGTNKLQGSFGTFSAALNYIQKGEVNLKESAMGIVATLTGAVTGAWTIQHMEAGFLQGLIPILLLGVLVYTLASPDFGDTQRKPKLPTPVFYTLCGLLLGFYDGFFGPGTGSFWTTGMVLFLGFSMTRAAGYTRVMNFTSNVVALTVFIALGNVVWSAGLIMAAGQVIGARTGSSLAIKNGSRLIKPIFITVVFLTTARLVYQTYL
ncbi:TSUP family transporter [Desulfoluna spongiiphila]|uniref:TSUP family transporter n=1 Tax=Desulfoluna spongiiphila TaxID=419481 RepID=UPI00125457A6|nr:TSUP family transporter [Desulfoluna spongiiphila]VVS93656.1 transmembrane protein taue-like [Desulfoluna spongiiphila]